MSDAITRRCADCARCTPTANGWGDCSANLPMWAVSDDDYRPMVSRAQSAEECACFELRERGAIEKEVP